MSPRNSRDILLAMLNRLRVQVALRTRLRSWLTPDQPGGDLDPENRLMMGRHSYGQPNMCLYPGDPPTRVLIGNFVSIAEGVEFIPAGGHPLGRTSLFPFRARWDMPGALEDGHPDSRGDILVGSDVWIGRRACVLSGVTIGHGAAIAAYSVVASDVRPYAVVAGNPAREVRRRFPDEICEQLLSTSWWEWPDDEIRPFVNLLTNDPRQFLAHLFGAT